MKKGLKIFIIVLVVAILGHIILGYGYIFRGFAFAYLRGQKGPGINEHHLFYNNELPVEKSIPFKDEKPNLNISIKDSLLLDSMSSAGFIVIKDKEIIHESYYNGFSRDIPTNSFSAAKSVVSLLIGVAIDEGLIKSVDQPVSNYLPSFENGDKAKITIRNLLTMSSGLSWSESGKNPYSNNAEAYYGQHLKELTLNQTVVSEPGKVFDYKSGDTQILTFILEAATGKTLTTYFQEKIWSHLNPEYKGFWNLDKEGGDEKGFCCLYLTVRDFAKLAQLIVQKGVWDGKVLVSENYINKAIYPAKDLFDKKYNKPNERYGWQWWYATHNGKDIHYGRGLLGQYYIAIPEDNLVIVRTGSKRKPEAEDGHTLDFWDCINISYRLLEAEK